VRVGGLPSPALGGRRWGRGEIDFDSGLGTLKFGDFDGGKLFAGDVGGSSSEVVGDFVIAGGRPSVRGEGLGKREKESFWACEMVGKEKKREGREFFNLKL
jgi:hypothetical protein